MRDAALARIAVNDFVGKSMGVPPEHVWRIGIELADYAAFGFNVEQSAVEPYLTADTLNVPVNNRLDIQRYPRLQRRVFGSAGIGRSNPGALSSPG